MLARTLQCNSVPNICETLNTVAFCCGYCMVRKREEVRMERQQEEEKTEVRKESLRNKITDASFHFLF